MQAPFFVVSQYIPPFISKHGNKKWVKLTDYLRMLYLYEYGGIFIDADVEIIAGRNFDSLLDSKMFVGKETTSMSSFFPKKIHASKSKPMCKV